MEHPATIAFGPFQLDITARLLQKDGERLALGARAFDILCVLVANAGKLVTKRDLLASVWQDVSVDDGSLRFHISALRNVLKVADPNGRYIETLAGRGYCFVAPVTVRKSTSATLPPATEAPSTMETRLLRIVGREGIIQEIVEALSFRRFVTLVGPGGIGKTTIATAVMHKSVSLVEDGSGFADLGPVTNPNLVPAVAAAAVGLSVQSNDPTGDLIAFLRNKRLLLVLDCCEPVIDAVAALAERLHSEAPAVHILATSREALRSEGEFVVQIPSLAFPSNRKNASLEQVLAYPAAKLFSERVAASGWRNGFDDVDASVIGVICKKLDGIPLAIELAAGLVNAHGVHGTADLLNKRFAILHQGRRTALRRHQTLAATLDWSCEFLSSADRAFLWQLAVFAGSFTFDAVREVIQIEDGVQPEDVLTRLVAKSLVAVDTQQRIVRYRLLDITRVYCLQKLAESQLFDNVAHRHAAFFERFLRILNFNVDERSDASKSHRLHLENIRVALDWAFSAGGDKQLGVSLASAAAPYFLKLSLLTECRDWCIRAISALDCSTQSGTLEIELQAAAGLSTMFTSGNNKNARIALERGLHLADKLGSEENQLLLVGRLYMFNNMVGNNRDAYDLANRNLSIAKQLDDPVAFAAAHSLLGVTCHLGRCQREAHGHLQMALIPTPTSGSISPLYLGVDYRHRAAICMARTLWLLGKSDQARNLASETVEIATRHDHPVTLCIALTWAANVCLWTGELEIAAGYIRTLETFSSSRSIMHYPSAGAGLRGYLLIKSGYAQKGARLIEDSLTSLHRHRYHLLTTLLKGGLAEGYAMLSEPVLAREVIEKALMIAEQAGEVYNRPELLRIKGNILTQAGSSGSDAAEACYIEALEAASLQSALGWELRAAISLAQHSSTHGRKYNALSKLEFICARFTEGFGSPDFESARSLTELLKKSADV